jgi:hypothetical protein
MKKISLFIVMILFGCSSSVSVEDVKNYVSRDPAMCAAMRFMCGDEGAPFYDENGCGCIAAGSTSDALDEVNSGDCSDIFRPVCGKIQVQCITTPCDPVSETFNNACLAEQRGAFDVVEGGCEGDMNELPIGSWNEWEWGNYGEVYVRGYAVREELWDTRCTKDCTRYDFVYLQMIETGNESFAEQMEEWYLPDGRPAEGKIGIGCVEQGMVGYWNKSDELDMQEFHLSKEMGAELLGSTEDHLVTVRLKKLKHSRGSGAPICYNNFAEVEVFKG